MSTTIHIVILVGVCGTGKSAIGHKIAQKLEVPFFDADTIFSLKNTSKGVPSTDIDLENWLASVEGLIEAQAKENGGVISCSILKKAHRRRLTANIDHQLDWVFMNDTYENVAKRLEKKGADEHPVSLLKSDFETLEPPKRALTVDLSHSEAETVDTILKYLARKYG